MAKPITAFFRPKQADEPVSRKPAVVSRLENDLISVRNAAAAFETVLNDISNMCPPRCLPKMPEVSSPLPFATLSPHPKAAPSSCSGGLFDIFALLHPNHPPLVLPHRLLTVHSLHRLCRDLVPLADRLTPASTRRNTRGPSLSPRGPAAALSPASAPTRSLMLAHPEWFSSSPPRRPARARSAGLAVATRAVSLPARAVSGAICEGSVRVGRGAAAPGAPPSSRGSSADTIAAAAPQAPPPKRRPIGAVVADPAAPAPRGPLSDVSTDSIDVVGAADVTATSPPPRAARPEARTTADPLGSPAAPHPNWPPHVAARIQGAAHAAAAVCCHLLWMLTRDVRDGLLLRGVDCEAARREWSGLVEFLARETAAVGALECILRACMVDGCEGLGIMAADADGEESEADVVEGDWEVGDGDPWDPVGGEAAGEAATAGSRVGAPPRGGVAGSSPMVDEEDHKYHVKSEVGTVSIRTPSARTPAAAAEALVAKAEAVLAHSDASARRAWVGGVAMDTDGSGVHCGVSAGKADPSSRRAATDYLGSPSPMISPEWDDGAVDDLLRLCARYLMALLQERSVAAKVGSLGEVQSTGARGKGGRRVAPPPGIVTGYLVYLQQAEDELRGMW